MNVNPPQADGAPVQVSLIDFAGFGSRDPQASLTVFPSDGIQWGTKILNRFYYDPDYVDTSYNWSNKWRTAIGMYNGGPYANETNGTFNNTDINNYINLVLQYIDNYQPINNP